MKVGKIVEGERKRCLHSDIGKKQRQDKLVCFSTFTTS